MQSGGSFDVDYSVVGPNEKYILDGERERQGDFVFTANEAGEYRFCFDNEMSTFAEKIVDFEIAVRLLPTSTLSRCGDQTTDHSAGGKRRARTTPLEAGLHPRTNVRP